MAKGKWIGVLWTSVLVGLLPAPNVLGIEITDKLSAEGVLAGVFQYQDLKDAPEFTNTGRGAVSFQPEFNYKPTQTDDLFVKLGFAEGNALNDVSPFVRPRFSVRAYGWWCPLRTTGSVEIRNWLSKSYAALASPCWLETVLWCFSYRLG
jgi:hypothetical protein